MNEITFKDKDLLVMKLLHYFITEKKYNPIILRGINNEIWLENLDAPYKIVRINTGYVHNNEQFEFDMFKTKKIMNKIKVKTLSFNLNTLSLFIDLGDNVNLSNLDNIDNVKITDENDIKESLLIKEAYPDINDKLTFTEKGIELFNKITNDINNKNMIDAKEANEVFTPKKPIVTYILMALCVIMYIITFIVSKGEPSVITLISFGGLNRSLVVEYNEYYRIVTCMFLHGGIIHLLSNMYALYIIGKDVESYYGKYKYAFIYFVSGIVGSLSSMIFSPTGVSVGASGAIFGLLGALLYFGYNYRTILNNAITKQILPVIALNLIIGFSSSGIDNFAHIGGLVGGIMAAMAMGVKYRTSKKQERNGVIVLILLIAFLFYMLMR